MKKIFCVNIRKKIFNKYLSEKTSIFVEALKKICNSDQKSKIGALKKPLNSLNFC